MLFLPQSNLLAMSKILLLLSLVLFTFLHNEQAYSQEFITDKNAPKEKEEKDPDQKRIFFGGQLGFQFGNISMVAIAPEVGYRFTPKLAAGGGLSYFYYASSIQPVFSTNIYGGKVFGYYMVIDKAFLYSEYEVLSLESRIFSIYSNPKTERFTISNFLVGPGYRFPLGKNSYLKTMLLWNLTETVYTPYDNPVVRLNFEF